MLDTDFELRGTEVDTNNGTVKLLRKGLRFLLRHYGRDGEPSGHELPEGQRHPILLARAWNLHWTVFDAPMGMDAPSSASQICMGKPCGQHTAILVTAVLLCVSTIMLLKQFHIGLEDPMSILNMNETNPMYLKWYNDTVQTLLLVGGKLGITYAAVNLLLYVLLLPAGIILCYTGIIKNLIRHT